MVLLPFIFMVCPLDDSLWTGARLRRFTQDKVKACHHDAGLSLVTETVTGGRT